MTLKFKTLLLSTIFIGTFGAVATAQVTSSQNVLELPAEFQQGGQYDPERLYEFLAKINQQGSPEDIPHILRLIESATAIDPSTPDDPEKIKQDLTQLLETPANKLLEAFNVNRSVTDQGSKTPEDIGKQIDVKTKISVLTRIMLLGHKRTYYRKLEEVIRKLAIPGEPNYTFKVTASPMINAAIDPEKAFMYVNFGLLSAAPTEDHLAGVIAHEMTHAHKKHYKAAEDAPYVAEVLDKVDGYSGLSPDQREEIRADLGAVDRLIRAGYNPWAYYDFEKKLTGWFEKTMDSHIARFVYKNFFHRSFDYMEAHPAGEIRMSAVKAYVLHRGFREDLSEHTQSYKAFGPSLKLLRGRALLMGLPTNSIWIQRGIIAYVGYSLFSALTGISLPPEVTQPIGNGFSQIGEILKILVRPLGYVGTTLGYLFYPISKTLEWADMARRYVGIPDFAMNIALMGTVLDRTLLWPATMASLREDIQKIRAYRRAGKTLRRTIVYQTKLIAEGRARPDLIPRIVTLNADALASLSEIYRTQAPIRFYKGRTKIADSIRTHEEVLFTQLVMANHAGLNESELAVVRAAVLKVEEWPNYLFENRLFIEETRKLLSSDLANVSIDKFRADTVNSITLSEAKAKLTEILKGEFANEKIDSALEELGDLYETHAARRTRESAIVTLLSTELRRLFKSKTVDISASDAALISNLIARKLKDPDVRRARTDILKGLVLAEISSSQYDRANSRERILILSELVSRGMIDTARSLSTTSFDLLYSFAHSAENKDPNLSVELSKVMNALKIHKTAGSTKLPTKVAWDTDYVMRSATNAVKSLFDSVSGAVSRITDFSAYRTVPVTGGKWTSFRYWLQRMDRAMILKFFNEQFHSVEEFTDFIEKELRPRNIQLEQISYEINSAVGKHPEWFKSARDYQLVMEKDYFWPRINAEQTDTLAFEQGFKSLLIQLSKDYPRLWQFDPGAAENIHIAYTNALRANNTYPRDFDGRLQLWHMLVDRGVTSVTDELFDVLYRESSGAKKMELEELALKGHVWEAEIKGRIARRRIKDSSDFKVLVTTTDPSGRRTLLEKVVTKLNEYFPERGNEYSEILEDVSQDIRSTPSESEYIETAKGKAEGERAEDFGLRLFSDFVKYVLDWKKSEQWNLVLFLRGDVEAGPAVKSAFRLMGAARIQRMFSLLPQPARTQLIDTILDSPQGLAPNLKSESGYGKRMIDHLLKDSTPESRVVAQEVLEAFLYSLKETGNGAIRSYVLAYLLAMPKKSQSTGEILKSVLEIFGASGIKIGQFLAASQILPEAETRHLRVLQDQASKPTRAEVYGELRKINNGRDMPVELHDLLGAASLKYAMSAVDPGTKERIVLKVLRIEAIANTRAQFNQLEAMAQYLIDKHGAKYGVFRSIIRASRAAVERELKLQGEHVRSRIARQHLYPGAADPTAEFKAPFEVLFDKRLVLSQFAEGDSIFNLSQDAQDRVAKAIMDRELSNFFRPVRSESDLIIFDPDRHAGNYRVRMSQDGQKVIVQPIDFGQLLVITGKQRNQVLDLFALSQVLMRSGSNQWAVDQVQRIMGVTPSTKLRQSLAKYFPDSNMKEVSGYYSLLAAMTDAGMKVEMEHFDFVRGIIQLSQYEPLVTDRTIENPVSKLKVEVEKRARTMAETISLTTSEKAKYGANKLTEKIRETVGRFGRESALSCSRALSTRRSR